MFRSLLSLLLLTGASPFTPIIPSLYSRTSSSSSALGGAIDTSDIKNGMTIELDGEPYKVMSFSIMKQARGAAKTTIKFKNLIKGNTIENTYRSGEKFETAQIDKTAHQYTYQDENNFYFMDMETFEEVIVGTKVVDDKSDWIEEGGEVNLVFFKGSVIEVVVPHTGVFEIMETEPVLKGNTASGHTKPALLSCGASVTVPGYLEVGEMIKVDTEKRAFVERAK